MNEPNGLVSNDFFPVRSHYPKIWACGNFRVVWSWSAEKGKKIRRTYEVDVDDDDVDDYDNGSKQIESLIVTWNF